MYCKGKVRAVDLNAIAKESEHYEWMDNWIGGQTDGLLDHTIQYGGSVRSRFIAAYL